MRFPAFLAAVTAAFVALPAAAQAPAAAPAPAADAAASPQAPAAEPGPDAEAAPAAPAGPTAAVAVVPPDPANTWLLDLSSGGRVRIRLRPDAAPNTVERIKLLTRQRFYDGLSFHRVIEGFMAQGGDPKGDGTGGSSLPDMKAEFNTLPHVRGAVAAARAENQDSANSQFYIVMLPRLQLDRKYTVFGRVVDGMQYVDAIERGEPPANPTRILHAYVESDAPPAYAAPAAAPAPSLTDTPTLAGARAPATRRAPPAGRPQPRR